MICPTLKPLAAVCSVVSKLQRLLVGMGCSTQFSVVNGLTVILIKLTLGLRLEEPAAQLLLSQTLSSGDTLCLAVEEKELVLRAEKKHV